jgi:predicted MPP superfamily phosphohydrolase
MFGIPFVIVVAASTMIDAFVALLALFVGGKPEQRVGFWRLVLAVVLTSIVFGFKAAGFWVLGIRAFGIIHLIYVDLVVLIPAIGAILLLVAVLGRTGRKPTQLVIALSVASLALVAVGVYATWIEPYNLQLETAKLEVPAVRKGSKPVTIGILTDLQTDAVTEHEVNAVNLLMARKPDVILLPGDVFQGSDEDFEATKSSLKRLLSMLEAPGGVYLVLGDTDGPGDLLKSILPDTSIRLLVNEVARVTVNGRKLTIGGLELSFKSAASQALLERLETEDGDDDIRIVLAHRPDVVLGLKPASRIDVVVAGHTHGGQIVIPGYGPPVTLSKIPRDVAAGGLHRIEANAIYVSRGVGYERAEAPRVRFFCPPDVSILELAPTPTR